MKKKYAPVLIVAVGLACYANALWADFVWDDFLLILGNPLIRNFNNLGRIFSSELFFKFDYYRPLQTLTYLFDYHTYGFAPWGYHLTNIIIHILNALLVFFIFKALNRSLFIPLALALLFVSSPIHTEAVTYISGRVDLILGAAILAAFFSYIKGRHTLSLLFFTFSLLAKEQAVIFPLILVAYDSCFRNRQPVGQQNKRLGFKPVWALFILIDAAYSLLRLTVLNFSQKPLLYRKIYFSCEVGILERIFTFLKSLAIYLKIIILPVNLHMERRVEILKNPFSPALIVLLLAGLFFAYLFNRHRQMRQMLIFGICWFLIMLIPQSSLVFPLILAEHFLYLPSIGIYLAGAILLGGLWQKKRELAGAILAILVLFYSLLTTTQNINWSNTLNFCRWTLKFSPASHKVHYLLAKEYIRYKLAGMALKEYRSAIQHDNNFQLFKLDLQGIEEAYKGDGRAQAYIYHSLGTALAEKGLKAQADALFKLAERIKR